VVAQRTTGDAVKDLNWTAKWSQNAGESSTLSGVVVKQFPRRCENHGEGIVRNKSIVPTRWNGSGVVGLSDSG